jgi:hypothetical protein
LAANLLPADVDPHLVSWSAWATDEIQVYNADIAEVGQWTVQRHALEGRTQPEFPGGSKSLGRL